MKREIEELSKSRDLLLGQVKSLHHKMQEKDNHSFSPLSSQLVASNTTPSSSSKLTSSTTPVKSSSSAKGLFGSIDDDDDDVTSPVLRKEITPLKEQDTLSNEALLDEIMTQSNRETYLNVMVRPSPLRLYVSHLIL